MKKQETNALLAQIFGAAERTIQNWRSRREQGAGAQAGTAIANALDTGNPVELFAEDGAGIRIRVEPIRREISPAAVSAAADRD